MKIIVFSTLRKLCVLWNFGGKRWTIRRPDLPLGVSPCRSMLPTVAVVPGISGARCWVGWRCCTPSPWLSLVGMLWRCARLCPSLPGHCLPGGCVVKLWRAVVFTLGRAVTLPAVVGRLRRCLLSTFQTTPTPLNFCKSTYITPHRPDANFSL